MLGSKPPAEEWHNFVLLTATDEGKELAFNALFGGNAEMRVKDGIHEIRFL